MAAKVIECRKETVGLSADRISKQIILTPSRLPSCLLMIVLQVLVLLIFYYHCLGVPRCQILESIDEIDTIFKSQRMYDSMCSNV